ncbi:MAG: hypothetical protein WD894_09935, partial [Pirellulales bacterium]
MFFHRSKIRDRFVSRRSRSHARSRGLRTPRFESLETRQMFDGTSILPMENPSLSVAPYHSGGTSGDMMPMETNDLHCKFLSGAGSGSTADAVECVNYIIASGQREMLQVPLSPRFVLVDFPIAQQDQLVNFGPLDAHNLLPYIEQDNVRGAVETLFAGGTHVAVGDINADGKADVLAVWNPWDINPGSLPPGVGTLRATNGQLTADEVVLTSMLVDLLFDTGAFPFCGGSFVGFSGVM